MIEAIRQANAEDLAHLADLAKTAVDEQTPDRGGFIWSQREAIEIPAGPTLSAAIDDPESLVLVGTIDEEIVGYARAHLEALRNKETIAVITDIFVIEGAREVGVGELMIEALVSWAGEKGCRGLDAIVLPGNRQTKNFFETAHFTARAIIVHHSLKN